MVNIHEMLPMDQRGGLSYVLTAIEGFWYDNTSLLIIDNQQFIFRLFLVLWKSQTEQKLPPGVATYICVTSSSADHISPCHIVRVSWNDQLVYVIHHYVPTPQLIAILTV
jgi:hypothetical protein